MHPALRAFASERFYQGRLTDGVAASERALPAPFVGERPLMLLDVQGRDERARGGTSRCNAAEVEAVVAAVRRMRARLPAAAVGVIAFYSGQVAMLQRALGEHPETRAVEARTVDGFQGREKEVIVLSCVRANAEGELGFLADRRRLNVAITRAKRALLVVGHAPTLRHGSHWAALLEHAAEHGRVSSRLDDFVATVEKTETEWASPGPKDVPTG